MVHSTADDPTYNYNMYVYLDVPNFNAIYSNGLNEIHIQVKFQIVTTQGADSTPVPTQDKGIVTLINYNSGAPITCADPTNNGSTTNDDDSPPGWKYKTTGGDYVNAFAPQAGVEAPSSPSSPPGDSKDGNGYILRDFYLYNDTQSNDGLQVAASLKWTDPNGIIHVWNTGDNGGTDNNNPVFVAVTAVIPKTYDATNTNGTKLTQEEEGSGSLPGGANWYQANYYFWITDARFNIKNATINVPKAGSNPGGDTQEYAVAVYRNSPAHFYYYIWDLGTAKSTTVKPFEISVKYTPKPHKICITKLKVTNYNRDGDGWDCQSSITIFDEFGNNGTFYLQKVGQGDSIYLK